MRLLVTINLKTGEIDRRTIEGGKPVDLTELAKVYAKKFIEEVKQ